MNRKGWGALTVQGSDNDHCNAGTRTHLRSITDVIGDTPLVRLARLAKEKGVVAKLLAKLEYLQSARKREGPHRRLHDRRFGA